MQKSLQLIVVAAVAIMVASSLFFLVSSRTGGFGEDTREMVSDAECDQLQGEFEQESNFGSCRLATETKGEAATMGCDTSGWGECQSDIQGSYGPEDPPPPYHAVGSTT